jgi:hypothetical protein
MPVRHREVSRIEGFSDAVFGFALTLLVVSLETPKDMPGLRNMAGSFLPFALTFAMVSWLITQHNLFFPPHGMQDVDSLSELRAPFSWSCSAPLSLTLTLVGADDGTARCRRCRNSRTDGDDALQHRRVVIFGVLSCSMSTPGEQRHALN